MNILLLSATALEINPFLDQYRNGWETHHQVDVLIGGIGLTATTYSLTKYLSRKKPDLVLQAGIGGSFDDRFEPGTVVLIQKDTFGDQVVLEQNKLQSLFDLGLQKPGQLPFRNGWLVNTGDFIKKTKLKKVAAISVNEITTSKKKIAQYLEKYHPVIESMEGAAMQYVCLMESIPFLQLRSVSNYIGVRDKKKWKMKESIENLNKTIVDLLSNID